jgi:hypothetical protein
VFLLLQLEVEVEDPQHTHLEPVVEIVILYPIRAWLGLEDLQTEEEQEVQLREGAG